MELLRIGDKLISKEKVTKSINAILEKRQQGLSQQEVAQIFGIDRSFISRLEGLGEIRKGKKVALVGFPVANKAEITELARQSGVEYILLLTEAERWEFLRSRSGEQLFNDVLQIISEMRQSDLIIFIGSNMRIQLVERLLDNEIVSIEIGESPITEDKYVDPVMIRDLLRKIIG